MDRTSPQPVCAGRRLREAVAGEFPLQVVGVINAYAALLARRAGFAALYLSGAGVANASYGLPDLAVTNLNDVLEDVRRVTGACDLPLLVDADTGFGHAHAIARTTREMIRAGAAGMHLEDQVQAKRCGHRPNKAIVANREMCDRIRAAVDGRTDEAFVVMARTDAAASEGIAGVIDRAGAYVAAGADMIFPDALERLEDYAQLAAAVDVPVLANITEFGRTPMFTAEQLRGAGVRLALYPLSAFRAMSAAAAEVYEAVRRDGTQQAMLDRMQTRQQLYDVLDYEAYERKMDQLMEDSGDVE